MCCQSQLILYLHGCAAIHIDDVCAQSWLPDPTREIFGKSQNSGWLRPAYTGAKLRFADKIVWYGMTGTGEREKKKGVVIITQSAQT